MGDVALSTSVLLSGNIFDKVSLLFEVCLCLQHSSPIFAY